jgi:hypothetical protein
MIKKYNATITYDTNSKHPDAKNVSNLSYKDIYTIDTDAFYGTDDISDYIHNDMSLVAGGGYETSTIKNVNFTLIEV